MKGIPNKTNLREFTAPNNRGTVCAHILFILLVFCSHPCPLSLSPSLPPYTLMSSKRLFSCENQRVLDALIRDGADVRKQNKFKNTPHDVANSAQCKGLLRRAEALPAPSPEEVESMHAKNLQVIYLYAGGSNHVVVLPRFLLFPARSPARSPVRPQDVIPTASGEGLNYCCTRSLKVY